MIITVQWGSHSWTKKLNEPTGHPRLGADLAPGAPPVGGCRRQACQSLALLGMWPVRGNLGRNGCRKQVVGGFRPKEGAWVEKWGCQP